MSKSLTQDLYYLQSICKYAQKFGITRAAIQYKKHKSYVFRWLNRYDGSLESLKKKSTRPHSNPNQHTQEEIKWIEDYKRRMPHGSLVDVWVSLTRNKGYTRSIPGLFRVMKRMGYYQTKSKKKPRKCGKMEPMTYPGERIQIDVKFVPKACISMEYPQKMYQFTAIDEYSRLRYIEAFKDNSSYSAKVFLIHTLEFFLRKYEFKVRCVQTDNGREFTNRFTVRENLTLFEGTLKALNIRHKLIRPYTPRHNGKVERSHREDQARFYNVRKFHSFEDFEQQLNNHLKYTNNRPMRPLSYLTPIEYLQKFFC